MEKKSKNTESFNLQVDSKNLLQINSCLNKKLRSGDYLSQEEIKDYKNVMLISLYNPGVSALWHPVSAEKLKQIRSDKSNLFPTEQDTLNYERIIYRGHQSAKIKVSYLKNGKKIDIKLKLGQEVHSDIATSKLLELIGFNQDNAHKKKVEINLGKTSYHEFKSDFVNKYGLERFIRYVKSYEKREGNERETFEDVLLKRDKTKS